MKKRRVIALLLALSLAVSTNSLTALATGVDIINDSVTIEEGAGEPAENEDPDDNRLTDGAVEDETPDGQDQEELPDDEKDADNPGGNDGAQGQEGDKDDIPDTNPDDGDLNNSEAVIDSDDGIDFETPEGSEEETGEEQEADVEASAEEISEVKMVTFTDSSGFQITYDAIAAVNFEPVIDNGVLTEVPGAEGVVDLREYEEITTIGENVFKDNNKKVTYVMLPKNVKNIHDNAFSECTALKGVSIPSRLEAVGAGAFMGCTSLTQLALPNSVISIGTNAFKGDSRLFMVYMVSAGYSKLETIGDSAFEGCSALEFFCSDAEYNLPKSLTSIGNNAFSGCKKIIAVNMGDNITSLGQAAYQNCSGIKEIMISSGITEISAYAFAGCSSLISINFNNSSAYGKKQITIKGHAFEGCTKLGSIEIPDKVEKIENDAFHGCTSLRRIVLHNDNIELESSPDAFPYKNEDLWLIVNQKSVLVDQDSVEGRRLRLLLGEHFVINDTEASNYYTYTAQLTGPYANSAGVSVKVTRTQSSKDADINSITNKNSSLKGVSAGTTCYVYITVNASTGVQVVPGSVKCNGEPINLTNGYYPFKMPAGGATITAELESKISEDIEGDKNSIEGRLSSDENYDYNNDTAHMKVGQTAKLYLINYYNGVESRIPASKITYSISSYYTKDVVSVDINGNIKALKEGTTLIEAKVKTTTGDVTVNVRIVVESVGIDHINLQMTNYDKNNLNPLPTAKTDNHSGVAIPKAAMNKSYTFNLEAVAFTSEDNAEEMAVAFTWETSDAKIAKLSKTSTTVASAVNTVTVPINTDGEATITVSATDANKQKVTQKFIVSVEDYTPRLSSSKITINPKQVDGTTELEIIGAYGKEIDTDEPVVVYNAKTGDPITGISLRFAGKKVDSDSTYIYKAIADNGGTQTTYSTKIRVKVKDIVKPYDIPLSIVVKESVPNPTVSFDKKQPKINLFYKNDGKKIIPVISKLGTDEVSSYSLEPLTELGNKNYDNDKLFLENFKIDKDTGVIEQQSSSLLTNTSKKPVVTGYLVLRFKNYKADVFKKYKITIPTETVAPSYVLNKTSATYNTYCSNQTIELQLLDKKNKNVPVTLDESKGDRITVVDGSGMTRAVTDAHITKEGKITFVINSSPSLIPGKVYLKLENDSWAEGKYFTYVYTIKASTADPVLTLTDGTESLTTLRSSTLTINPNYKDQTMKFGLKSNQDDTDISKKQIFIPQFNDKNKTQYDKLSVTYENGVGHVSLNKGGEDIANGTYTFVCEAPQCTIGEYGRTVKKVTLKVKVAKSNPTVTVKGSLTFNTQAKNGDRFIEEGELTLTAKNLPENYKMHKEDTLKTIVCTTKNYENYKSNFNWEIVQSDDDPLVYSLKVSMNAYCKDGTYKFSINPKFTNQPEPAGIEPDIEANTAELAKAIAFSLKVYRGVPTVSLSAKGKLNLLDREPIAKDAEYQYVNTTSNSIIYTPTIRNVKDTVTEAEIYDADAKVPVRADGESKFFTVKVLDGKLYVSPIQGVQLENNKTYKVAIWMKLANYNFSDINGIDLGGMWSNTLSIKSAQVLPKVITDKSEVNLYLSNKNYEATFTVDKKDINSIGEIESIAFGENDTKALESFVTSEIPDPITEKNIMIDSEQLDNGALKVKLRIKNGVVYGCNTTNKITMYVRFKGQGSNTAGTAITMNVKINK